MSLLYENNTPLRRACSSTPRVSERRVLFSLAQSAPGALLPIRVPPAASANRSSFRIHPLQKIKASPFGLALIFWWERMDSNHRSHRQQIYSLPPLATRELSHIFGFAPPALLRFALGGRQRQLLYRHKRDLSIVNFKKSGFLSGFFSRRVSAARKMSFFPARC